MCFFISNLKIVFSTLLSTIAVKHWYSSFRTENRKTIRSRNVGNWHSVMFVISDLLGQDNHNRFPAAQHCAADADGSSRNCRLHNLCFISALYGALQIKVSHVISDRRGLVWLNPKHRGHHSRLTMCAFFLIVSSLSLSSRSNALRCVQAELFQICSPASSLYHSRIVILFFLSQESVGTRNVKIAPTVAAEKCLCTPSQDSLYRYSLSYYVPWWYWAGSRSYCLIRCQ